VRIPRHSYLRFAVLSSLLLIPVLEFAQAKPSRTKEKDAGPGTYQVESKVKGLSVFDGDTQSGVPGTLLKGRVGFNEIEISAPNYARRKIRFWIKPNETRIVTVDMAEIAEPVKIDWKSPFKRFDAKLLGQKASLCTPYQAKFGDKLFCDRKSLLQDIVYADDSLFAQDDLRAFQGSGDLVQFRRLVTLTGRDEASSEIEDFLASHPNQRSAFHLASFHSLLRGDCPRVHELYTELSQSSVKFYPLTLHMAVCAEANSNKELRDKYLAEGLKPREASVPIAYWSALLNIESSVGKASEFAVQCLKTRPTDSRCQDMQGMVLRLQGKPARSSTNEFEDPIFAHFTTLVERLKKDQGETLYFESASLVEQFPLAIENYLLMTWINMNFNKEWAVDDYASLRFQVSRIQAGGTLDKIIDAIEAAGQTQLLPPIYRRRLAFSPHDPNLWYRLIRSYAKTNECKAMLTAFSDGNAVLPKYNPSLLQMRGACEVELNRFAEAVTTFKKAMEINPKIWSSPYNLANSYERLGKKTEAYAFFKKTLELSPPEDVKTNIQARLKFLEPSKR
jgi:tetratricopeptide (TPR) repeat protein